MIIVVFCIIALLFTLADVYIVVSVLHHTSWFAKVWLFIPPLAYWALILWMFITGDTRQMTLNSVMWFTIGLVLPTLVFALLSIIGKELGRAWHPFYPIFTGIGICVAVAWLFIFIFGSVFGWRRLEVKNTDITLSNLPENFNGYRIVQLSDLHIGLYEIVPDALSRIVKRVNSLNPDLIVFTGDLVNISPEEVVPFAEMLSQLNATDGVISILGNHDYCVYKKYREGENPDSALALVIEAEDSIGWNLLRNESVQIVRGNDSIAVVGIDYTGSKDFPDKSDIRKAMEKIPENECTILLCHDPSYWRKEVLLTTEIPLMLAGHTHGMQFQMGNFSPASWLYPEWNGLYAEKDRYLNVNTGVGGNFAFRFGVYPTIDVLTLHCPESSVPSETNS
ncbi:MAG: metallophosphoesterase [Barnesiella sp.]|nr:metallophosphoesterase [Barnesiella sp.]